MYYVIRCFVQCGHGAWLYVHKFASHLFVQYSFDQIIINYWFTQCTDDCGFVIGSDINILSWWLRYIFFPSPLNDSRWRRTKFGEIMVQFWMINGGYTLSICSSRRKERALTNVRFSYFSKREGFIFEKCVINSYLTVSELVRWWNWL